MNAHEPIGQQAHRIIFPNRMTKNQCVEMFNNNIEYLTVYLTGHLCFFGNFDSYIALKIPLNVLKGFICCCNREDAI